VIVTPEIVAPIPVGQPLPQLNFPEKFLPPNSNMPMTTPGASVTGVKPPAVPPSTMPVEQLIQSMKPEKELSTEGSYSSGGYAPSSTSSTSSTPQ
jgi:pilus assembly protein CpaC